MQQTVVGGTKKKAANMLAMAGLIIIFIAYMFPFLMVVINSLKQKRDIIKSPFSWLFTIKGLSFDNFVKAFTQMDFLNAFKNSLIVTVSATALVTLFAAMLAYYIVRHKNWISKITFALMVASMIIPFQVVMLPLISTFRDVGNFVGISLLQSIPGIVFAYCGFGGAMTVFILTGFIKGIPYELEEAASIDGCSPEGTFFRIIFPLLTPVITTVTILNGMWIWNDYLLPSLMLGQNGKVKTLPVAVQAFVGSYVKQWDLILTAALLAIIPMVIIFLIAQKQIMNGMVEGAIK